MRLTRRPFWPQELTSALPAFFGDGPVLSDPWPAIRDVVAAFSAQAAVICDQALHEAVELDGIDRKYWGQLKAPTLPGEPLAATRRSEVLGLVGSPSRQRRGHHKSRPCRFLDRAIRHRVRVGGVRRHPSGYAFRASLPAFGDAPCRRR